MLVSSWIAGENRLHLHKPEKEECFSNGFGYTCHLIFNPDDD
jgi:hypothetical protein